MHIPHRKLTNSKEQIPSREANSSSAGQEFNRVLWKNKILFPHPVPVLRQINPVHNLPTDLLSILILSPHLRLRHSSSLFL